LCLLALFACLVLEVHPCSHAGGPLSQSALLNYIKNVVRPILPLKLPAVQVSISGLFSFGATNLLLGGININNANIQLTQPNTVVFGMDGFNGAIDMDWTLVAGQNTSVGKATLGLVNCKGSITAQIEPDHFKNTNAMFAIGDVTFQTTNQPAIQPYWNLLKPIVVDTLQRELPNLALQFDTEQIKALVFPIVQSVEPVHIPDLNKTVLGVYGGFSNATLHDINFQVATMGRGSADNEALFELTGLSATITNSWEFKAPFGIDMRGTGHITVSQTSASITVGLGVDQNTGDFTINLDAAKISIGNLDVAIDGGNNVVINFIIAQLEPLVVTTIEAVFQVVVCVLFNGIPN